MRMALFCFLEVRVFFFGGGVVVEAEMWIDHVCFSFSLSGACTGDD